MRLRKQLLTENNCYKAGAKLNPIGVMWHSTGANNPRISRYVQPNDGVLGVNKYGNHWNTSLPGGREVCVHAFIGLVDDGTVATYQTLPWTMRGWHAGGTANATHIGFEICEDDLTSVDYFNKVYKEACELTAYLCAIHNWDPMKDGVIICHSEGYKRGVASNHSDVTHWFSRFGKSMDDVRKDVNELMGRGDATAKEMYRVQCGAYTKLDNAKDQAAKLQKDGFDTYIVVADGIYKVQCGAYTEKTNAYKQSARLTSMGYSVFITTKSGDAVSDAPAESKPVETKPEVKPAPVTPTPSTLAPGIKEGDMVRVNNGAKTYTGGGVAAFVYDKAYRVDSLKGDRAVLDEKGICTPFNVKDLTLSTGASVDKPIEKNDRVRVKRGAKSYTGGGVASFVYDNVYTVDQLKGDRAVLDAKGICTPFNVKDLIRV